MSSVDLQKQLRDIAQTTFNGVSLFADYATKDGTWIHPEIQSSRAISRRQYYRDLHKQ